MRRSSVVSFAAAGLLLGSSVVAIAAPKKKPSPPAPAYSWTGWYAGLNAGGAWGRSDVATTTALSPTSYFGGGNIPAVNAAGTGAIDPNGFTGGGQIGYNWQLAPTWVAGIETDFSYFHLSGSRNVTAPYPANPPFAFNFQESVQTNWLFTARPRLGWANNNWLVYVTGGVAVTQLKYNSTFTDNYSLIGIPSNVLDIGALSTAKVGWTIGGGVEAALWSNWSAKLEYLFVDFGSIAGTSTNSISPAYAAFFGSSTNPFFHSAELTANILRLGLNYKFN